MTTLRDRPDPGTGGDEPTGYEAAHCPHCGNLIETGVELPWPTEPVLCLSCERWVGRARALPASAIAQRAAAEATRHAEPAASGNGAEPRSHRRRRHSRPAPSERRRARELGPPPVPRFASEEPEPAGDLDLHDDAFAATGVWDAPADPFGPDESAQPASDDDAAAREPDAPRADTTNGAVASPAEADEHAPPSPEPFADPPVDAPPEPDDDLGPPAPFFAPAAAPGQNGSAPVAGAAPVSDPPGEPRESLPARGSGTLPFWSVPSEPPKPKRRLSLKRLRPRRPKRPTRAGFMRKLPIVLLVIGALLLIEGALTVLWKEPFSAILAGATQNALGGDLDALERRAAAEADAVRDKRALTRLHRRRSVTLNRDTEVGKPLGRLRVKKIGLNEVMVQGTDDTTLQKGPGHYTQTPLPGQKGNWTVGIAGHRTTYGAPFRRINELDRGDEIVLSVPYGRFTYEVEKTEIVDDADTSVMVPKGYDRIALTACHPLYSAAQRIIAYGKLKKSEPRGGAQAAAKLKP